MDHVKLTEAIRMTHQYLTYCTPSPLQEAMAGALNMDDEYYESVISVFVDLYEKGYIYRGIRMVNWDPQAKTAVSDEEVNHRKFYETLLSEMEPFEAEERYPGEYFEYLHSYADGNIFSQEAFERKLREIDSAGAALEFAIGVEWDSIHFYQELKGLVPENRRDSLDKLIAEERKHFVKLVKIRKNRN